MITIFENAFHEQVEIFLLLLILTYKFLPNFHYDTWIIGISFLLWNCEFMPEKILIAVFTLFNKRCDLTDMDSEFHNKREIPKIHVSSENG